ncbi:MAG: phage holin family protein [Actinobacteria bacterium]|nr:phage holin family protein [Actinomycetota bacterium]
MPTQETDAGPGLGSAAKQVAEHASSIARLEIELASLELKKKLAALGLGIGLLVGALLVAVYGIGFLFATIAAALATFLPVWLSLLVVTLFLFVVTGALGVIGLKKVQRGTPPVPKQAIDEAKLTTQALKRNGNR